MSGTGSGVVEIRRVTEPAQRNWPRVEERFAQDREALRRHDHVGCAALEMAEAMDRFLGSWPQP